jgi:hypothetical protein
MRLYELLESLDKDQQRVGQVAGEEKAKKIGTVLGTEPKQHPYKGRLVGENETVDEASLATMRDYFAGNLNAQDEMEITKQRKYYQELKKKEEEQRRRREELQKYAVTKIGGNIKEVAPPGMEDWIKHRKADFKKRYGDRWQEVLYATAWKRKNNESIDEATGLSPELLSRYKKAAGADAAAADKKGDFERGNKRFSGIIRATKKEFDNDQKRNEILARIHSQ